jgi:hypothetical protein
VTTVHVFSGTSGRAAPASLLQAIDGNFYGTTLGNCTGHVFRMSPSGAVTVVYTVSRSDGNGGCVPFPGIVAGVDGNIYGTTLGSPHGARGTIYRLSLNGQPTIIREFDWTQSPTGSLVHANDGQLYGAFASGSPTNQVVGRVSSDGSVTPLHTFSGASFSPPDESGIARLVRGTDGHLWGTAASGGFLEGGTIFRLCPPAAPAGVSAGPAGATGIRVSWAAINGAATYRLTRRTASGPAIVVSTGSDTSFLDAGVTAGTRYFYVVTAINAAGESLGSNEVAITPGRGIAGDFDGDGKTDLTVFRALTGMWYILKSGTGFVGGDGYLWGQSTDAPQNGDFDADGRADLTVYRPTNDGQAFWFIVQSSTGAPIPGPVGWGQITDVPTPGDYEGDGKTDRAVFRPDNGTWYILTSSGNASTGGLAYQWGAITDVAVPADYDGDGRTDLAVYRPSTGHWFIRTSSTNFARHVTYQWGILGDIPVAADYDGDGTADLAVYRPSTGFWYLLRSSSGFIAGEGFAWGADADVPVPGDYDGDGRTDITVYRPSSGHWFILKSSTYYSEWSTYQWGMPEDIPVLKSH